MAKKEESNTMKKTLIGVGLAAGVALSALLGAGYADDSALVREKMDKIAELEARVCPVADYSDYTLTADIPAPLICADAPEYSDDDFAELEARFDAVIKYVEDNVDEDLDVDYILFRASAEFEAEKWIKENFIEFLDDEDYFDNGELLDNYRKSEVSIKKIYDVEVENEDYEDLNADLIYEVKLKAKEDGEDREYFSFAVTIPFEDSNMEDEDIDAEHIKSLLPVE